MPALRRPCTPSQTPDVRRSASTRSGGNAAPRRSASSRGRSQRSGWRESKGWYAVLAMRYTLLPPLTGGGTSKIGLAEAVDHLRNRRALGASREIERHTVAQDRMRKRDDIVDRRRKASFEQRPSPDREHKGLARARRGSPGDEVPYILAGAVVRTSRAHQAQDRLDDLFADRKAAHQRLRPHQGFGIDDALRRPLVADRCRHQHLLFGFAVGITDIDLQQETVELRFGKRIGAFLLQRILGGEHMEGPGQVVTLAADRH